MWCDNCYAIGSVLENFATWNKRKKKSNWSYLMLFPRILRVSNWTGSLFLMVIFTDFKCVFIATSTPVTVPWTWVPFFSSIVTLSCESFMRNLEGINMILTSILRQGYLKRHFLITGKPLKYIFRLDGKWGVNWICLANLLIGPLNDIWKNIPSISSLPYSFLKRFDFH